MSAAIFRNWRTNTVVLFALVAVLLSRPSGVMAQTPGLVAAYSFNEGSGPTVSDTSGNNLTGMIVGATWTTAGRYGNALSFNGSSSYVDLGNPAALQLTGSMTLEAWINAAANPGDDGQIVAKSDGSGGWQFKTSPDTGPHTFGVAVTGTSGTNTQRYSTTVRSLNTWYHVAGVYNASAGTLDIYVNGTLNNGTLRGTIPNAQVNQTINANIGRRTGGFYFNGIIDEVRIYSRALSQTEIQNDMNTPIGGTPPPPDTTPPTVSMTSPLDGATVMGTLSVSASASDNVGVAGVQFLLDGANLGSEVQSSPYTVQWDSSTAGNGTHILAAIARDFAGNTTISQNISVTVTTPSPQQVGQWSPVQNWPIVAVHAMLLPTGDVLAWSDYTSSGGSQIWSPSTNTFTPKPETVVDLFCAGHAFMADGRLLVTGGIMGTTDDLGPHNGTIFDPNTGTWSQGSAMIVGRYYPTATTLSDGRVLVQGGTTTCGNCIADIPEIYDPVANIWTQLAPSARMAFKYYPHSFVLPDGRVLVSSQDDSAISSRVLDLKAQTWTTVDSRVFDGHSAAMYLPGQIIKAGTATADNPGFPSAATTYVLDMTQSSPAWQQTGSMAFPRSYLNLTVLPDGQVLATGGSTVTDLANFSAAVYAAELWSPVSKTWTTMSNAQTPRLYHSTALLLPDARVLVAGGGRQGITHGVIPPLPDLHDEPNAEIFSPPYLFKGPRPVISSAPTLIPYGTVFSVVTPDAARIASVSLIALGAVTHAFNENQRFVPLTFGSAGGSLNVQAPVDGNTAPPGPYMLFLVDNNGIPSVAAMVRLPGPGEDIQPPTPPANLNATASPGIVSLTWSASTDNVGVTGYNVYRSTTSGFTPITANKIGQTSATTFADTSFSAAGSYYYLVTARDAAGNVSSPSNQASVSAVPDTTPPTVSITSPVSGANLSGVVNVSASASDDIGVAGVQFLLDGNNLGAEVTGSGPTYTVSWTTNTTPNGAHTLSARARDGAGNTTVAANVGVTVSNVSGLVAAYSFSEGSGTTVRDTSGNNLTGVIAGATWTTAGRYGNALSFNGSSSYVDLGNPAALQLTGNMTLEAWINAAANPGDDGQIVAKSDGSGGWQFKTSPDTGPHTFGVAVTGTSGTNTQRYSTTVRSLNTWYHVAGVYNASAGTLDIYVNGTLDNGTLRGTIPNAQVNQTINANIGRRTGGFYFNGIIDEVRIYSRALSQVEIQNDMNTPIGSGTPPDTTPPTPPSGLTATPTTPAQINLSWTASTDNVGVTGYRVERCQGASCGNFAQIASLAGTTLNDTGLLGSTSYSYRVRATDAANNLSTYSNTASATTAPPTFTAPSGLAATASGSTQINLTWTAATETGGTLNQYLIERCAGAGCSNFAPAGTSATLTFNDTGVTGSTSYAYRVRATDALNNLGPYSNAATVTTPANTPSAPTSLTAMSSGPVQINLSWTAATETGGTIANYLIERCSGASCSNFAQVAAWTATTFNDAGLTGSTSYTYRVRAIDTTNVTGPYSNTASAITAAPTFTAPSGLTASAASPAQINLSWTAATETGGTINQYLVERCTGATCSNFVQVGTSALTTFSSTGLLGSTTYSYRVRATDPANNLSTYSNAASATTAPPTFTAPSNLSATSVGSTQINLSWTAGTEIGGTINQYPIERCQGSGCSSFAQIATSATTSFNNAGLLAGTSYSYRVRAGDAASNFSTFSNIASATTSATAPPPIAFVQSNSAVPQTSQLTVSVPYTRAQTAGNLNFVAVGWNDSVATVSSVKDTNGNLYVVAVGPTVQTGSGTQTIYYAKNISAAAPGANIVTVTFAPAAVNPDIRIAEYSGLDTVNPVDVTAGAQGNNSTSSSGAVTTTNANDLLVGANLVQTVTTRSGTGYTSRTITSPDGDILEDRVVTAIGSYSATAPVSPPGPWIMQLVAFRAHP